jgi:hypothetical protein
MVEALEWSFSLCNMCTGRRDLSPKTDVIFDPTIKGLDPETGSTDPRKECHAVEKDVIVNALVVPATATTPLHE